MRIDKLSLTALVATLAQYCAPNDPFATIPVLRMLTENTEALLERTQDFARSLGKVSGIEIDIVDTAAFAGGGTLPTQEIPSKALRLRPGHGDAESFARTLRLGTPAVIGRIRGAALLLDLRTVARAQQPILSERIAAAADTDR